VTAVPSLPGDKDLAVEGQRQGVADIIASADCRGHLATDTETRVQLPIGRIVPHQREVLVGSVGTGANQQDLLVPLERQGVGPIIPAADRGGDDPVARAAVAVELAVQGPLLV